VASGTAAALFLFLVFEDPPRRIEEALMGQSKWVWGCALFAMLAGATWLGAQEKKSAEDPFGDGKAKPTAAPPTGTKPRVAEMKSNRPSPGPSSPAEARRRIEHILDQPLASPMDFVSQPLRQVAAIIAEQYEIPVQFDTKALDAIAVTPDQEVTIQIANVTLRYALELMLKNAGADQLAFVVDRQVLLITTEEAAQRKLEVRIYRVDDLGTKVPPKDEDAAARICYEPLIEAIIECVEHDSWAENGTGAGQIAALEPGMLVVAQTDAVHKKVQELLTSLHSLRQDIGSRGAEAKEAGGSGGETGAAAAATPGGGSF
jgi:hypothetical protein